MNHHVLDVTPTTPTVLVAMARSQDRFSFSQNALNRLAADRKVVEAYAAVGEPVYGLNTGLGGNLGYRLAADEVQAFQQQVILGRMIAMGEPLPTEVVRAALLGRCISVAKGGSGISVAAAQGLLALLDRGVTPIVPRLGSIGAGDLGLCAHLVAPLIGHGEAIYQGQRYSGAEATARAGLVPVALQAKDGLGLISASPLTAGYGAVVGEAASDALLAGAAVASLALEGYAANLNVFDARLAAARPCGAQVAGAALFRTLLAGSALHDGPPRAVQDAISFRTLAPGFGTAYAALAMLLQAVDAEINGNADSPVVFSADRRGEPDGQGALLSSPNFHTGMIALAFDAMAIALTHQASASVQRIIKLQSAHLSGLPKYLSPVGGASVGFNALQKTAAAIYAEIRQRASPTSLDAVVVSDTVEDHASNAMLCIRKLDEQVQLYCYLVAIEALVAAQAVDLRGGGSPGRLGDGPQVVFRAVRAVVAPLGADRPCGPDAMAVHSALFAGDVVQSLRRLASGVLTGIEAPVL